MSNDFRPYRDIHKRDPEVKKTEIIWIIAVLILVIFPLCSMFCSQTPPTSQRLVPVEHQIRVREVKNGSHS